MHLRMLVCLCVFFHVYSRPFTVKQMPSIHLCMLLGNKLLDSLKDRNNALCVISAMYERLWCCVSERKMTRVNSWTV